MAISHDPPLDVAEVKRTAQAFIYFEAVLDANEPDRGHILHRNQWRNNSHLTGRAEDTAILDLEEKSSIDDVRHLMVEWEKHADGRCFSIPEPQKLPRWHHERGELPEIVIYSPRGRDSAEAHIQFAKFTLSFIEAALSCPLHRLRSFPPTPQGLRNFITPLGGGC